MDFEGLSRDIDALLSTLASEVDINALASSVPARVSPPSSPPPNAPEEIQLVNFGERSSSMSSDLGALYAGLFPISPRFARAPPLPPPRMDVTPRGSVLIPPDEPTPLPPSVAEVETSSETSETPSSPSSPSHRQTSIVVTDEAGQSSPTFAQVALTLVRDSQLGVISSGDLERRGHTVGRSSLIMFDPDMSDEELQRQLDDQERDRELRWSSKTKGMSDGEKLALLMAQHDEAPLQHSPPNARSGRQSSAIHRRPNARNNSKLGAFFRAGSDADAPSSHSAAAPLSQLGSMADGPVTSTGNSGSLNANSMNARFETWRSEPQERETWGDDGPGVWPDDGYPSQVKRLDGYTREVPRAGEWEAINALAKDEGFALLYDDRVCHHFTENFLGKECVHWVSVDVHEEIVGPVAVTVEGPEKRSAYSHPLRRVLVRTKKGDERHVIPADEHWGKETKALARVLPHLSGVKFRAVRGDETLEKALARYEERIIKIRYMFGVLYCQAGQGGDEAAMYNNRDGSPDLYEFMDMLATRIEMKGFTGHRGGLDVRLDSTGTHSYHTMFRRFEIMFHVSTMLTYTPDDPQQVERKRHLGNDVTMLVFYEGDDPEAFLMNCIQSQFNHVFIIVSKDKRPHTLPVTHYRVSVGCKYGVRKFGPALPSPPVFPAGPKFREFLLAKLVNGERAAMFAPDFVGKMTMTRQEQLKDIISSIPAKQRRVVVNK